MNVPEDSLNEREFELINIIGAELSANQRDLSKQLDISLGMTNLLVRRLAVKGYIRIRQLNKRKMEYILTSKGFSEKLRKSIRYTIKTLNSIEIIKNHLKTIFKELYQEGERNFNILGNSDLALLAQAAIQEVSKGDHTVVFIPTLQEAHKDALVCICKEGYEGLPFQGQKTVNLITELAQRETRFSN